MHVIQQPYNPIRQQYNAFQDKKNGLQIKKWWTPENKENREYTDFIETWLKQWVGYAEESVFEVNMLVINGRTSIL